MGIQSFDEEEIKQLLPKNKFSLISCTFLASCVLLMCINFNIFKIY